METLKLAVLLAALLAMLAGGIGYYVNEKNACEARGGALVRAPFLFACVKGA